MLKGKQFINTSTFNIRCSLFNIMKPCVNLDKVTFEIIL